MLNPLDPPKSIDDHAILALVKFQRLVLSKQRPIGVIAGKTGSCKGEALNTALLPFLAGGGCVIRIAPHLNAEDPMLDFLQANKDTHRGLYTTYVMELDEPNQRNTLREILDRLTPPEGAVIVIEEPQALKDVNTSMLFSTCDRQNVAMVLVVQDLSVLGEINLSRVAFIAQSTGLRQFTVAGAGGLGQEVIELDTYRPADDRRDGETAFALCLRLKTRWAVCAASSFLFFFLSLYLDEGTLVIEAAAFGIAAGYLPWQFQFNRGTLFANLFLSKTARQSFTVAFLVSMILSFAYGGTLYMVAIFIALLCVMIPRKLYHL
jgi:hypothetical protein